MSTRGTTYFDEVAPMEWKAERRPCPFCEVKACGCPSEPADNDLVLIPPNVTLGTE